MGGEGMRRSGAGAESAPARSRRRTSAARLSGIRRGLKSRATAPIGTLIRKIQGQPTNWVSSPPSRMPKSPPAAPIAPQMPKARLNSAESVKMVTNSDCSAGSTIAAPTPWSPRASSSAAPVGASGEQAETDEIEALPPEELQPASPQQQE